MKYFILKGLLPEPQKGHSMGFGGNVPKSRKGRIKFWKSTGLELPDEGDHCVLMIERFGKISVFIHDVFDALILISATSQEKAYSLALSFRAFFSVYFGYMPDEDGFFETLIEIDRKPEPIQTKREIAQMYRPIFNSKPDLIILEKELGTGYSINHMYIKDACKFVKAIISSSRLAECLRHVEQSHFIFSGFMSGSYYQFHYSHQRRDATKYQRSKKYLENRTRFDLAFLSAFKALEAILGKSNLKEHEITQQIIKLDQSFGTNFAKEDWRSYHEMFTRKRKFWSLPLIISKYLKLRNSVAAHGNIQPPFQINEDQVFEIQRITEHMLYTAALNPERKN